MAAAVDPITGLAQEGPDPFSAALQDHGAQVDAFTQALRSAPPPAAPPPDAEQPAAQGQGFFQQLGDLKGWGRALGLTGRNVVKGVLGLPVMAGDAVTGLENYFGANLPLPSQTLDYDLNAIGLPQPQTGLEKTGEFVESGLAGGSAMKPVEQAALSLFKKAPAAYQTAAQSAAQVNQGTLRAAQQQGSVVPPATTNPTLANNIIETIAGKQNVQNSARAINDAARTKVAGQALGLGDNGVIGSNTPRAIMDDAGDAYTAGRQVPKFDTDPDYAADMQRVLAEHRGANESFPGAVRPDVEALVKTYDVPNMTGNAAVSAWKLLGVRKQQAFRQGDSELGRALGAIRSAIFNQLQRAAPAGVAADLRAAGRQYADAATVENALSPEGTVLGPKLVAEGPISGPLKTQADFAESFPLANRGASASGSNVNHLGGFLGTALGSGMGAELLEGAHPGLGAIAGAVVVPAVRYAAKKYALSGMGQAGAIPRMGLAAPQPATSALGRVAGVVGAELPGSPDSEPQDEPTEASPADQADAFLRELDAVSRRRQANGGVAP